MTANTTPHCWAWSMDYDEPTPNHEPLHMTEAERNTEPQSDVERQASEEKETAAEAAGNGIEQTTLSQDDIAPSDEPQYAAIWIKAEMPYPDLPSNAHSPNCRIRYEYEILKDEKSLTDEQLHAMADADHRHNWVNLLNRAEGWTPAQRSFLDALERNARKDEEHRTTMLHAMSGALMRAGYIAYDPGTCDPETAPHNDGISAEMCIEGVANCTISELHDLAYKLCVALDNNKQTAPFPASGHDGWRVERVDIEEWEPDCITAPITALRPFIKALNDGATIQAAALRLPRKPTSVEQLIEGFACRGTVVAIAGESGIGKSVLAAQIAGTLAHGGKLFGLFGTDLRLHELVALAHLENTHAEIDEYMTLQGHDPKHERLVRLDAISIERDPERFFEGLSGTGVKCIIIDPVAAHAGADNINQSATVRRYLAAAQIWAMRENGVVIFMHHLNDAKEDFAGSREFSRASRVNLKFAAPSGKKGAADTDRRTLTDMGRSNWPASLPEEKRMVPLNLRMDRSGFLLVPDDSPAKCEAPVAAKKPAPVEPVAPPPDDAAVIAAAVSDYIQRTGKPVFPTGKTAPHALKLPQIKGWSRARCRDAHTLAIQRGLLAGKPAVDAATEPAQ